MTLSDAKASDTPTDTTDEATTTAAVAAAAAASAKARAVQAAYPERYYALYDPSVTQPAPVTGWIDAWALGDASWLPPETQMLSLSADRWNARQPVGQAVQAGAIVAYAAAAPCLAPQAHAAMTWVNVQAALASAMGATFGAAMKTYVQALQAIIAGTDTGRTVLPDRPAGYND